MIVVRRRRAEEKRKTRRRRMKKADLFRTAFAFDTMACFARVMAPQNASFRVTARHFASLSELNGGLARDAPLERHRVVHVEQRLVVEPLRRRLAASHVGGDLAPLLVEQVAPKQD